MGVMLGGLWGGFVFCCVWFIGCLGGMLGRIMLKVRKGGKKEKRKRKEKRKKKKEKREEKSKDKKTKRQKDKDKR